MNALSCADILAGRAPQDAPVTLQGWVRTRRDSKAGISFVHVSDGRVSTRCRWSPRTRCRTMPSEVSRLTAGCAVDATGMIVPSPAKGQPFEMQASALEVVGWVDDPDSYPIQPKPHTLEFLREVAHLRPRTNVIGAVSARPPHDRAGRASLFRRERLRLDQHADHHDSRTPKARARCSACRRWISRTCRARAQGKVDFGADFFGREAFLTVSGQLNVETYCLALSKVYTFGPTFRAENSNTSRHLAEFWMIEPEIAFADLADNATLAEELAQVHLPDRARRARRRHGVLRGAHRKGRASPSCRE